VGKGGSENDSNDSARLDEILPDPVETNGGWWEITSKPDRQNTFRVLLKPSSRSGKRPAESRSGQQVKNA